MQEHKCHLIVWRKRNGFHTRSRSTNQGNILNREVYRHCALGNQQNAFLSRGIHCRQQAILTLEADAGVAALAHVQILQRRAFDHAALRGQQQLTLPLSCRQEGDEFLILFEPGEQAARRQAALLRAGFGDLLHRNRIAIAQISEKQQLFIGHAIDHLHRRIIEFSGRKGLFAELGLHALDKAIAGQQHPGFIRRRGLLFNHNRLKAGHNFGAARIRKPFPNLAEFLFDDRQQFLFALENRLQIGNALHQLRVFFLEGNDLQIGQALQTHIQYRLRLYGGQGEAGNQLVLGLLGRLTGTYQANHLVQIVHGDDQAFQDVRPGLCLRQLIPGAAGDHILLMADVVLQHPLKAHLHRLAARDGHHVHAEGDLHIGILVEHLQKLVRIDVFLQFHHGAHAHPVGFIADIIDTGEQGFLFLAQTQNFLQQRRLVDLIGNFIHHDEATSGVALFDVHLCAHLQLAATGFIGLNQLAVSGQNTAGGKIRCGDIAHQLLRGHIGLIDQRHTAVDHLAQIMGRNVGGQTHGDAARAVHQQIGIAARQQIGFLLGIIKVQVEIHGVLIDILQHDHGELGHARLGIAHRGGAVAVDGTEVTMAVHQHGAHHEGLRHAG